MKYSAFDAISKAKRRLGADLTQLGLSQEEKKESLIFFNNWTTERAISFDKTNKNFYEHLGKYFINWRYRKAMISAFSYPIITQNLIYELAELLIGLQVVDIGCGTGYLTNLLSLQNTSIVGVNESESDFPLNVGCHLDGTNFIIADDAVGWLTKNIIDIDCVILSWPPCYSLFGYEILKTMKKNQILIYQGEPKGGCTGSNQMFNYLNSNFKYKENESQLLEKFTIRYSSIHDYWGVYSKL